jgi:acetyltransferase-like isoleucine patch superfamily enzyme
MIRMRPALRFARGCARRARWKWYAWRTEAFGDGAEVEPGARLECPEKIRIGDGARVARNAVLRANTDSRPGIVIGTQSSILENALVNASLGSVLVGNNAWIGPFCLIYGNGGVRIGNDVLVAGHTALNTVSHRVGRRDLPIRSQGLEMAPLVIEDDVWIGLNAVVLQGVTVGRGAVVAAGAVVTRDVPPYSIVRGVPARVVGERPVVGEDVRTLTFSGAMR